MDTIKRRWVRPCGQKRRDQQGAAVARVRGFGRGDLDSGTDYYSVPRVIDRITIYIYIEVKVQNNLKWVPFNSFKLNAQA
jgi:hypothetical protein